MAPEVRTPLTEEQGRPDIAEFFRGKSIFITGGTGFLGKLLVETLLRCCPDIKQIYLLCRPKKGKTIKERILDQLMDPLYDYIKSTRPEVLSKIVPMAGENLNPNLGLSDEDLDTLIYEANVIFHVAATIRFDEELRQAVPINVRSTRDILLLARRMTRLSAFVHVSTAYSNCVHKTIDEKFYPPPIDGDLLIELMGALGDETLQRITPGLVGEYPNTYTFTKCVAEDVIRKYSVGLPIAMIRPAIVTPTYKGPCPGWTDNLYGPVGIGIGISLGIIHALQTGEHLTNNFIPADYVINAMLAAAWGVGTGRGRSPTPAADGTTSDGLREVAKATLAEPPADDANTVEIYNSVTSDNPITWGLSTRYLFEHELKHPCETIMWKPFYTFTTNRRFYSIYVWFVHWIPAYVVDTLLRLVGQKPKLVPIYTKMDKFQAALSYFTLNEWVFSAGNTKRLFEKLSNADKTTFPFDVLQIDWLDHMQNSCKGVKKYILKEGGKPAHTKLLLFNIAHYVLCVLMLFVLFKLLKLLFY